MQRSWRQLISSRRYADVVATLALIVALGGSAYAAISLPKNSVGSKQIKRNAVAAAEIRRNAVARAELRRGAVDSSRVRAGSLLFSDFKEGEIPPNGPRPPTGPAGGILSGSYPNPGFAGSVDGLIPVAVLNIAADGTLRSESHRSPVAARPTVTHTPGSGTYAVTLPGAEFFFTDDAAICTDADAGSRTVSVNSNIPDVYVEVRDAAGTKVDSSLYCSIWDLR